MKAIKEVLIDYIFEDVEKRNDVIAFYAEYFTIALTIPQLLENLSAMDNRTLLEIAEDTYTDTCVRDDIHNFHSQLLIGENWPTYGDGEQAGKLFIAKLALAYHEKEYKVNKE